MYEDNDNLYLVSDMDEDIKKRKELIEEAKNINADKNWNEIYRQISDLRRKWKRISSWESAYEDSLNEELNLILMRCTQNVMKYIKMLLESKRS